MKSTYSEWIQKCKVKGSANLDSGQKKFGFSQKQIKIDLEKEGFIPSDNRKIFVFWDNYDVPAENKVEKIFYTIPAPPSENQPLAVTSYIINTDVEPHVWKVFMRYCKIHELKPVVIPLSYRNPTSLAEAINQESEENIYIDPLVRPYLVVDRFTTNNVTILADVRPQITAATPLSGLESLSRGNCAIVGHGSDQLISIPRMHPAKPVIMMTTGSVSKLIVGHSLAAKKAEFHHVYGFVRVDFRNNTDTPIRNVPIKVTKDDAFLYDVGYCYTLENVVVEKPAFSNWGDLHFGAHDESALNWAKTMSITTGVRHILLNDTFDGSTINHHDANPLSKRRNFKTVREEVDYHNKFISELETLFEKVSIVNSNHNNWLDRWLTDVHPMLDIDNAEDRELYSDVMSGIKVLNGEDLPSGSILNGHMLLHGHETTNGGKLSPKSLARLGYKVSYAHTHSPMRFQGVHNVGCLCQISQPYTEGSLTSWAHGISLVYPSNKTQSLIKLT